MCLFNGVENPDEAVNGCDECWTQWMREQTAQALYDAEQTLANHLGYYLGAHYLTDHQMPWAYPMQLKYGHIVGAGTQERTAVIPTGSDFTVDPATITVTAASFPGGADEIVILENTTGLEIVPDSITAVGANFFIQISQCKLIEWDNLENQAACIEYDDEFPEAAWLKLADLTVYREYLDTTDQATVYFVQGCTCSPCEEETSEACVYILNPEISKVKVELEECGICGCVHGSKVSVNYLAGTTDVPGWEQAIIRLAHTLMVVKPCGCALFDALWERDTRIPTVLTAERINCPFGEMDGAWWAWKWVQNNQHGIGLMLGATSRSKDRTMFKVL